jgi:hypothetical protein
MSIPATPEILANHSVVQSFAPPWKVDRAQDGQGGTTPAVFETRAPWPWLTHPAIFRSAIRPPRHFTPSALEPDPSPAPRALVYARPPCSVAHVAPSSLTVPPNVPSRRGDPMACPETALSSIHMWPSLLNSEPSGHLGSWELGTLLTAQGMQYRITSARRDHRVKEARSEGRHSNGPGGSVDMSPSPGVDGGPPGSPARPRPKHFTPTELFGTKVMHGHATGQRGA